MEEKEEEEEEEEEMDGWMDERQRERKKVRDRWMGEREKEKVRESWRELMSRVQQQQGNECQWGSLYFMGQKVFIFKIKLHGSRICFQR